MRHLGLVMLFLTLAVHTRAGTIGTFYTSVGTWEIEFFDEEKPITVSNFLKYATSGRYVNQIIHRWAPGFVIQGGAYRVETEPGLQLVAVPTYGAITNEYNIGPKYSNTYGTIAMARLGGETNSATSQWYINLGDNSGLDAVDGGFTVFGHLIGGTNIVNLFIPPPPAFGIYTNHTDVVPGSPVPVLNATNVTFDDLVYVQVALRREVGLTVARNAQGERQINWISIAGVTNVLEYNTNINALDWPAYTNFIGSGAAVQVTDGSNDPKRIYRVKALY